MAKTGKRPARATTSNRQKLNTSWLNNAMKSIGAATASTFKDISPTMYSMGSAGAKAIGSVASTARQNKASLGNLNKAIAGNKYIQLAKKTMDQSIADLKSGNLYNDGRASESMGGFDDFNDSLDDMFGDFDSEDVGNVVNIVSDDSQGSAMIADAITKGAEMNLRASKASVDTMIALTSTSLNQQVESLSRIETGISDVANSVNALLQYHEENTTKFYETMIGAVERMGKTMEDRFKSYGDDPEDLFTAKGGLNGSAYKKYLKKNITRAVDHSLLGPILPFLKDDEMIEMLVSDPVGGITKGVIGGMIPSIVSGTLKELDNTVTTLIPNLMSKLAKEGAKDGASPLMKKLSEIFGIRTTKKNNIDLEDRFNKSAAVFDDVTRNTIVEVLPKYARESTSYLRAIAMHVTKKSDSDLLSGAQIFDTKDSTYKTQEQLRKSIAEDLQASITDAFKQVDFGKILGSAASDLGDKEKASYEKAMNQFFVQLSSFDAIDASDFDLTNSKSAASQALRSVNGKGKNAAKSKKLLTEALKYMYENNTGIDSAMLGNIKARSAYSKKVDELGESPELSNILAAGITSDTDLSEFLDRYTGNTQAMKIRKELQAQAAKDAKASVTKTSNPRMKAKDRVSSNISSYMERGTDDKETGGIIDRFISEGFTSKISSAGNNAKNSLFAIMKGDTKGALDGFNKMFSDIAGSAWTATKDGFFKPLATKIFGKKDGEGIVSDGLMSGLRNNVNDTIKSIMQKINGKDYTDSEGKTHTLEDKSETLVGKANKIFSDIGTGIHERLFGKKDDKKDDDKPGIISNMITSLNEGIRGWKEALFGPSDDPDHKKDMEAIKKNVIDALPNALIGAGSGAILGAMSGGSLLGALVGGPVGGAVIGLAGGLLSRSDKFKDWLFGPEVDDGNGGKQRIGGFISKGAQDFLKDNKNTIIGGAALGAMKSIVFPNSAGLLTSIVGGPIAGAAIGAGFGIIKNSETFNKFLYGDEETGKRGVIQAFKDIFKGKTEAGDKDNKGILKALGMGAIGAGGFALTSALVGKVGLLGAMATPGGPIGAALVGAAVGIGASSQKFREFIFGTKDEETGKHKGGLVQKFGNYVQVELLQPMKSKVMDIVDDAKTTFKYDILENVRAPFIAVADGIKERVQQGLQKVGDLGKAVVDKLNASLIKPVGTVLDKLVVQPMKKFTSTLTDFMYRGAKTVVTAPFKLVGALYKRAIKKDGLIVKGVKGIIKHTKNAITGVFKGIGRFGLNIIKGVATGVGTVGGVVKGVALRTKDKFEERNPGLVSKIGDYMAQRRIDKETDPNAKDFLTSRQDAKEQRRIDAENKRNRRNLDKNRRMMAKYLGYDEKYFTEETMQKAELAAGKKINWAGTEKNRTYDQTPEQKRAELLRKNREQILSHGESSTDIEVRHLSEEMKTNKKLDDIYGVLYKSYMEMKGEGLTDAEAADLLGQERDEMAATEKAAKLKRYNRKHGGAAADLSTDNEELLNDVKSWGDNVVDEVTSAKTNASNKVSDIIRKKGLLGAIKGKFKRSPSKFDEWFNSVTVDDLDDPNLNAKVMDLIADDKHRRAEGGDINKDEPYLVGERGNDLTSAEIIVPNKNGKVLSQQDGGIKVNVTGIGKGALESLKNFFTKRKKEKESEEAKINAFTSTKQSERAEMNAVEQRGSYATQQIADAKKAEAEKQEERDSTQRGILQALLSIGKGNKKHHSIWETIFSKKGLIGAGLAALVPFLWKNKDAIFGAIGSIASVIGDIASKIGSIVDWTNKNGARDDGNTVGEQIGKEAERAGDIVTDLTHGNLGAAVGDFVLDDGVYDAQSGSRVNYLANQTRVLGQKGIKVAKGAKAVGTTVGKAAKTVGNAVGKGAKTVWNKVDPSVAGKLGRGELTNSVDLLGSALNENAKTTKFGEVFGKVKNGFKSKFGSKVASSSIDMGTSSLDLLAEAIPEAATSMSDDIGMAALQEANGIVASSADDIVSAAAKGAKGKVATESVEKVAETASKKGASKVAKIVAGFFDDIAKKCFKKAAAKGVSEAGEKAAQGAIKRLVSKVSQCLMKHFGKIASQISAVFAGKGTLEVVTAGLSTAAFVTIGFINGAGKGAAARLFQVDQSKVDWKMHLISGALGGITTGTVTGSVIDIVCGLIADILGFDLLNMFATTIYKAMSSDEKDDALDQAQAEWKESYVAYKDEELEKNYEVQQKLGNISSDVTLDQYKEGVQSGQYKATYKGFDDWNADKNQSLGSKIGKGVTKGWNATKQFFGGKNSYKDANGNVYADIGGGQYEVYGSDGKKIGVVSKDSVDVSNMEKTTKGGIKNGLKSAGKAISGVANKVGSGIVGFGKKVGSGVKDVASSVGDFASNAASKVKDGVISFGKGVGDTVGGFMKQISNVGSAIMNGQKQIEANFNNKDLDFAGYFKSDVNTLKEDHPLHGLVGGLLNGSKVVSFPILLVKGIMKKLGSKIGGFVKETTDKVSRTMSDINKQQSTLTELGKSGDINGLNNFQYNPSDDNPMAGISKAIVGINRIMMYPNAGLHWVGNKIKEFFTNQITKVKTTITSISPEMSKISDLGKAGDLEGLNAYTPEIADDNPMAGISKGILTIDKFFHYPTTLLHYAGNKIKEGFTNAVAAVKQIGSVSSTAYGEMKTFSDSGDLDGLMNYNPAVPEDTPLSGFVSGVLGIGKYALAPNALIHKAGNSIHDAITSGINKIKDVGTELKDYTTTLLSYTDPDKDMSGFDKETMGGEDSPVGKIIAPMVRGVIKFYVNIRRALNKVGDFIQDKIEDVTEFGSDVKDSVVDTAGNIKDAAGSALSTAKDYLNGIGTTIMNFGRGGRGDKSPETVNGFDYYSQNDDAWKSKSYISNLAKDGATMGDSGCGPTAMSMVVSQASNGKVTPTQMADLASRTGFRDETGTNAGFIGFAGDTYGLQHQDAYNPSAEYIQQQVAAGNSVVLNGYSNGSNNSAFTKAGHYVVAVGMDDNGNILVNDPRGKEYSRAYAPSELAGETAQSWSFAGGAGPRRPRNMLHGFGNGIKRVIRRVKNGGRGVSGDWLSIVKSVKALVAAKKPTYDQGGSMTINYNGKDVKLRPDCSGLVGCMLRIYGAIPSNQNVTSTSLCSSGTIKEGFTYGGWSGWDNLKEGDIITKKGHVEVFAYNKDGKHYVYNGGSTNALCSPGATETGHKNGYTVVWRPGNAGTGAAVVGLDGVSYDSSGMSSGGSTDILGGITNVFSQYASAALNGVLTGNFDSSQISWSGAMSGGTTSDGTVTSNAGSYAGITYGASSSEATAYPSAVTSGQAIPSASADAIIKTDIKKLPKLDKASIEKIISTRLAGKDSVVKVSDAAAIKQAQDDSGISALALMGIATQESGLGTSNIAKKKYNLWGWNATNANPSGNAKQWASVGDAFAGYAYDLNRLYYAKRGEKSLLDISGHGCKPNIGYAYTDSGQPSTSWAPAISKVIKSYLDYGLTASANGGSGTGRKHFGGYGSTKSSRTFTSSLSNTGEMSAKEKISYGIESSGNIQTSKNGNSTFNSKALLLMESMIEILKQIGVNTEKLEDITKTGNVTSVNNGKSIVVNSTTTESSTPETGSSRNARLASQIARGY